MAVGSLGTRKSALSLSLVIHSIEFLAIGFTKGLLNTAIGQVDKEAEPRNNTFTTLTELTFPSRQYFYITYKK
jgi:hypothetical protein